MTINIYYCWFGKNPLSDHAKQCLQTWKQYMPQANMVLINEQNFNISWCRYTQQAYEQGRYAFVSDVARLYFLYHYGGIYLDTDVFMNQSLEPLLSNPQLQVSLEWYDDELTGINTGTIICPSHHPIIKKLLDQYCESDFQDEGAYTMTINQRFNAQLLTYPIEDSEYDLPQVKIYPSSYFCRKINEENYTVHDYQTTWRQQRQGWLLLRHRVGKSIKRLIGPQLFSVIWRRK